MKLLANVIALVVMLFAGLWLLYSVTLNQGMAGARQNFLQPDPVVWLLYAENSPLNQRRTIQTALLWARLNALPTSARHLIVDSTGELFTKRYVITFDAKADEIATWLDESPGTAAQSPEVLENGDLHYTIAPRDAASAEVVVSADQHHVKIVASWS